MLVDSFANRLNKAISIRNIKPAEIVKRSELLYINKKINKSLTKPLLSNYQKGKYEAKQDNIYTLALILDVDEAWLMGADVPMERNSDIIQDEPQETSNKQVFPILGVVRAGYNYLASENIVGYVNIDKKVSDPENYFALRITGNSMQPILFEDDIIIVHKQNDLESGQVGIILLDDEVTVKKVIKYDNYIELVAFNSYYPPKKLTKKDKFQIIGKVTEARISKVFE